MGLWWGPFTQSRKCMSLNFTGWFCIMIMKNDAKFEEDLTCQFKIDIRNLTNFDLSTQNLKYLHFNTLFLTKVYNVWAKKKYREVTFDGTEHWCKIWRKIDLCFIKIFICRLKNSDFILESIMTEVNWKQNFLIYFENCQNVPYSYE